MSVNFFSLYDKNFIENEVNGSIESMEHKVSLINKLVACYKDELDYHKWKDICNDCDEDLDIHTWKYICKEAERNAVDIKWYGEMNDYISSFDVDTSIDEVEDYAPEDFNDHLMEFKKVVDKTDKKLHVFDDYYVDVYDEYVGDDLYEELFGCKP
jgi:hypothetical protein